MSEAGPPLDDHQYSVSGLRTHEAIYGRDFISPGGASFMMATQHQASVLGIDLSHNMVDESIHRCEAHGLTDQVTLVHGDILTVELPGSFDLVHSREVFLDVQDKRALFRRLHSALRPGGRLLFTDYCCGTDRRSPAFISYVEEFGYDLRPIAEIAVCSSRPVFPTSLRWITLTGSWRSTSESCWRWSMPTCPCPKNSNWRLGGRPK